MQNARSVHSACQARREGEAVTVISIRKVPIVQNVGCAMCMAGRPGRSGGGSSTGQASATDGIRWKKMSPAPLV